MNKTIEKQADVKNGVSRMIFAVISILLEVAVILLLLYFAGQKAGWILDLYPASYFEYFPGSCHIRKQ